MKGLDKASASAAVKLVIFIVITTLSTGLLAVMIGNIGFGDTKPYKAVFSDVTGLNTGDDIRIAGVKVGSVNDIEVYKQNQALVTFDVASDAQLTTSTLAQVHYRNLVGQRYIALTQGEGSGAPLAADEIIPIEQTEPALDLNVLFNGFKPLFEALSPDDVNTLAYEIIRVLQGEGGTVESLLSRTGSVTQTLANRDQLVGDVITNLNDVLDTVGQRDEQLSRTIITLQQFATGLKDDRQAILGSLDSVSDLAVQTASLVSDARPGLTEDIRQLRGLAGTLSDNKASINRDLQILPIKLDKIGHTATYGSFFNFYLCNFEGSIDIPSILTGGDPTTIPLNYNTSAPRCAQ